MDVALLLGVGVGETVVQMVYNQAAQRYEYQSQIGNAPTRARVRRAGGFVTYLTTGLGAAVAAGAYRHAIQVCAERFASHFQAPSALAFNIGVMLLSHPVDVLHRLATTNAVGVVGCGSGVPVVDTLQSVLANRGARGLAHGWYLSVLSPALRYIVQVELATALYRFFGVHGGAGARGMVASVAVFAAAMAATYPLRTVQTTMICGLHDDAAADADAADVDDARAVPPLGAQCADADAERQPLTHGPLHAGRLVVAHRGWRGLWAGCAGTLGCEIAAPIALSIFAAIVLPVALGASAAVRGGGGGGGHVAS